LPLPLVFPPAACFSFFWFSSVNLLILPYSTSQWTCFCPLWNSPLTTHYSSSLRHFVTPSPPLLVLPPLLYMHHKIVVYFFFFSVKRTEEKSSKWTLPSSAKPKKQRKTLTTSFVFLLSFVPAKEPRKTLPRGCFRVRRSPRSKENLSSVQSNS